MNATKSIYSLQRQTCVAILHAPQAQCICTFKHHLYLVGTRYAVDCGWSWWYQHCSDRFETKSALVPQDARYLDYSKSLYCCCYEYPHLFREVLTRNCPSNASWFLPMGSRWNRRGLVSVLSLLLRKSCSCRCQRCYCHLLRYSTLNIGGILVARNVFV